MSETTGSVNCPECGMEFDSRDELARHSKHIHAIASSTERSSGGDLEERVQSRTEEKGRGETAESLKE